MTPEIRDLSIKAATLSRGLPKEWSQFLASLDDHLGVLVDAVLAATPDQLQVAQGRAQAVSSLLKILNNANQTVARIEAKK